MSYTLQFNRATRLILALLFASALATCCGCGGGGGGAGTSFTAPIPGGDDGSGSGSSGGSGGGSVGSTVDTTPPTVAGTTANPVTLTLFGGTVTISAQVTDNIGVAAVAATVTKPDGTTTTVTMSGSGTFTGTFQSPGNATTANQTYSVSVGASDASGNTALGTAKTFVVQSADAPPQPPS